ncbi:hypothetical protein D3C75_811920 [compost metagenome]
MIEQRLNRHWVTDVAAPTFQAAANVACSASGFQPKHVEVNSDHLRPLLGKPQRHCAPDSRCRARDQGDLSNHSRHDTSSLQQTTVSVYPARTPRSRMHATICRAASIALWRVVSM